MKIKIKASATVEALLILPCVITFFFSFIWLIDVFRIHAEIGEIVNDAGLNMVTYSYAYVNAADFLDENEELGKAVLSLGWSELYLKNKIKGSKSGTQISERSCLMSDIFSDDNIDLTVTYRVSPLVDIPGFKGFILTNRFFSNAFVGHKDNPTEEVVYITKGTEVYHTSKECRALVVNTESVLGSEIDDKRNKKGGRYFPCEYCANGEKPSVVFITPYGTKYHFNQNCKALNTTVFCIPKNDVGERRECFYCQEN